MSDIVDLLIRSRELLDSALSRIDDSGNEGSEPDSATQLTPREDWSETLQRRLGDTRREVVLAVSDPIHPRVEDPAGEALLRRLIDEGKQVRVLLSKRYAHSRRPHALLRDDRLGDRIRVTDADFHNTMVIDQCTAVLWTRVNGLPQTYVTTDYTLMGAVYQFATQTWAGALPLRDHVAMGKREFDEPAVSALRFLNDGVTDEVAARRLSVSLRTYRRYVAELMSRLDVTTRFQLGVRAAELGLLDEQRRTDA